MSNLDDYLGMLNELRVPTARVARYNSFGPVSEPDVERYSRLFTLAQQFLATSPTRKNLDTFKTAFSETARRPSGKPWFRRPLAVLERRRRAECAGLHRMETQATTSDAASGT